MHGFRRKRKLKHPGHSSCFLFFRGNFLFFSPVSFDFRLNEAILYMLFARVGSAFCDTCAGDDAEKRQTNGRIHPPKTQKNANETQEN